MVYRAKIANLESRMEGERIASNVNLVQSPNAHIIVEEHHKYSYAVHTLENSLQVGSTSHKLQMGYHHHLHMRQASSGYFCRIMAVVSVSW